MPGFIKLDRDILNSWLWSNDKKSKFEAWIYLLMGANWQDGKITIGYEIIEVKRGQFFTSQDQLSKVFRWDRSSVRKFLYMMESNGSIELFTTHKYTMITICNYASYQDVSPREQHQHNINTTSTQHQTPTTKKNKEEKEEIRIRRERQFKEEIFAYTDYSKNMLTDFFNYWSEPTKDGEKMRYELEKTWDNSRRLATWSKRTFDRKDTATASSNNFFNSHGEKQVV